MKKYIIAILAFSLSASSFASNPKIMWSSSQWVGHTSANQSFSENRIYQPVYLDEKAKSVVTYYAPEAVFEWNGIFYREQRLVQIDRATGKTMNAILFQTNDSIHFSSIIQEGDDSVFVSLNYRNSLRIGDQEFAPISEYPTTHVSMRLSWDGKISAVRYFPDPYFNTVRPFPGRSLNGNLLVQSERAIYEVNALGQYETFFQHAPVCERAHVAFSLIDTKRNYYFYGFCRPTQEYVDRYGGKNSGYGWIIMKLDPSGKPQWTHVFDHNTFAEHPIQFRDGQIWVQSEFTYSGKNPGYHNSSLEKRPSLLKINLKSGKIVSNTRVSLAEPERREAKITSLIAEHTGWDAEKLGIAYWSNDPVQEKIIFAMASNLTRFGAPLEQREIHFFKIDLNATAR